jgi:hypothetical protein
MTTREATGCQARRKSLPESNRDPHSAPREDTLQSPIKLSDAAMDAILSAAQPIDRDQRSAFLQAVAAELAGHATIGDGLVSRVCRDIQKRFFHPPTPESHVGRPHAGKYA